MEREKTISIKVCDSCGNDKDVFDTCIRCGRDFCFKCAKLEGIEYRHSVHAGGSGDGFFCKACDIELRNNPQDKYFNLHDSYWAIKTLRDVETGWYKRHEADCNAAEECLQYWLKQLNLK